MHSLRDLQERFAEVVFNPRSYCSVLPIQSKGLNGRRRLRIYRNNVFASLTAALRACYPVVERLVGEGFFAYVANRYIRSHPSTSGDLQEFGSELPEFLEDFPTTRALVYLPDVARLEWARQHVYHALEPEVVELSARLQAVPPKRYGDLRFRLHPAGQLLFSPYPILRIWQVNQEDYSGEEERVDLSEGAVYLLIIRCGLAIKMESLSLGEYLLLNLLGQGEEMIMPTLTQTALITRKTDRVSVIRTITAGLDWLSPLADLAVRLWVATAFFKSGLVKIQSWDSTLALFTYEYSVPFLPPELAAYLGAFTELFFPVLLVNRGSDAVDSVRIEFLV